MDIAKYREMFLTEATEHLQNMVSLLVEVEAAPEDQNGIAALFREAHSIKGMAATMSYSATAQLAHHLEDQLDNCRSLGQISSTQIDYLLAAVDLLEGLLQDIRQELPERSVEDFIRGEIPHQSLELLESVSCSEDLDNSNLLIHLRLEETVAAPGPRLLVLLKKLGEFGSLLETIPAEENILQGEISRILEVRLKTDLSQEQIFARLQKYSELAEIVFPPEKVVEKQRKQQAVTTTVRVGTDLLDRFINLTGELITNRYSLQTAAAERNWSGLNEGLGQLARLVKNLHHQVLQVRM
ncbi:MAG: Hpt domain-containing protein, partial [Chloroflexi bacterium]|nr:Hpt domain-containing protein [Chloroflexota bacterium]